MLNRSLQLNNVRFTLVFSSWILNNFEIPPSDDQHILQEVDSFEVKQTNHSDSQNTINRSEGENRLSKKIIQDILDVFKYNINYTTSITFDNFRWLIITWINTLQRLLSRSEYNAI